MPPEPSVTSASRAPLWCTLRSSSALFGKISERPGPKSVSPPIKLLRGRCCRPLEVNRGHRVLLAWWKCSFVDGKRIAANVNSCLDLGGWPWQPDLAPGGRGGFQSTSQRDELKH